MKRATLSLLCTLSLAVLMTAQAQAESRTWTSSADPTKTFEGKLVAATATHITVLRSDGQTISFPLAVVSAADQAYAKEKAASLPSPEEAAGGPVPGEIAGALSGGSASLGTAEYFIIWCAANR